MEDQASQERVDRVRRRLLKLGVYVAPTLLSLTTFLGESSAPPPPPLPVELRVRVDLEVRVRVTVM